MHASSSVDYKKIFEILPGCFVVLSTDFFILEASDAYLTASNLVRENIIGKNYFDLLPDVADRNGVTIRASLEKVLKSRLAESTPARKYDIPRAESEGGGFEVQYWSAVNAPVLSPQGEVECIIRRVDNVTTLINREGERQKIERELDLLVTYSFDLLGVVGTDGYFKRVNPAFGRTMGYTEQEFYEKPIIEFLHPDDVAKTQKGIQILSSGRPTIDSINRYRCKDGTYKWFSWNTTPMGPLLYTIGRDITERALAEERIQKLNAALERKNEDLEQTVQERLTDLRQSEAQVQQLQKMDAIGRLAGGIAHDFNNMLGAMSLYCDLLEECAEDPEAVRRNTYEIAAVTKRAAALTRQLLVFSRKQIIQLQALDLNPLIQTLENMLMRLIGENIRIVNKLAADLQMVRVDASQIEQVILNLVMNAKDAMPPQGGTITIETSNVHLDEDFTQAHFSVTPGDYVLLSVSDNGVGMDTTTVGKIFEPFFTTKPAGKGTGLGLTTTYGIIKQSRGSIWVYSEPDKGTVFKIYLPIATSASEEPGIPVSAQRAEIQGTETVLLVEDDDKLREGFAQVLRKRGYKVLMASEANEALDFCHNYPEVIHLLLTDVVMPGISGFELAKKALGLRQNLQVLYMSGYTNDALEKSGIENIASLEFLQKPFGTSTLVAKVQEVLNRYR